MKLISSDHCTFLLLILLQTPLLVLSQGKTDSHTIQDTSPLVLKEKGTEHSKAIKQGTFLKVFIDHERKPSEKGRAGANRLLTGLTKKIMFKGQLHGISNDSLRLVLRGRLAHIHVDEVMVIKAYYSPMRRFAGSAINAGGMYLMTLGGTLAGLGVKYSLEGDDEGLGSLFFFSGIMIGGTGFLVHRLGLLFRRNKYDLKEVWYIDQAASYGG